MKTIKHFRDLLSILMLYAADIIVRDRIVMPEIYPDRHTIRRITGRQFLKLTACERT